MNLLLLCLLPVVGCFGMSPETDLRKELLADYDSSALPAHVTNVSVAFTVLGIRVDEQKQVMVLDTWVKMEWIDTRLSWAKTRFPEIERLAWPRKSVWSPDLTLYNNAKMSVIDQLTNTMVVNWPSGKMLHVPTAVMPITCVLDMTYWPRDVQNCTLKMGSWVHSGHTLVLKGFDAATHSTEPPSPVTFDIMKDEKTGLMRGEWEVIHSSVSFDSKYYDCCPEPYMSVSLQLVVRRNAPAYCSMAILPAFSLSVLTGVLFLLPPGSLEKVVTGTLILILDFQFISYMSDIVEHSPSHTPLIVQFVGEQVVLTLVCIVISVLVLRMVKDPHTDTPPAWLQKPVSVVEAVLCVSGYRKLARQAGKVLYPMTASGQQQDGPEDQVVMVVDNPNAGHVDTAVASEWLLFGAVLDRLLFIIYVLAFFIKLASYNAIM